jgi:hypothetical protein
MSTIKHSLLFVTVSAIIFSCVVKEKQSSEAKTSVVEISATYDTENDRHLFKTESDTIPSGWTTFRFNNSSPMVHFMVLELMPGNRTSKDSEREVVPIFQDAMDLINADSTQEGFSRLGELPDWFAEIGFIGGPGFTSPGKSAETTVYLKPGNYVMECYVKTGDGIFHSALGMLSDLRVSEDSSDVAEPTDPTIEINLSNEGFDVNGEITPGTHLVAVHFNEDEPPLLGNDVHVVRLGQDSSIDSVAAWVDWSQSHGLVSTAEIPAPAEFLGGTHEMPKGNTAYFTVELIPGEYAWISERPADNSMYQRFTVESETVTSN